MYTKEYLASFIYLPVGAKMHQSRTEWYYDSTGGSLRCQMPDETKGTGRSATT